MFHDRLNSCASCVRHCMPRPHHWLGENYIFFVSYTDVFQVKFFVRSVATARFFPAEQLFFWFCHRQHKDVHVVCRSVMDTFKIKSKCAKSHIFYNKKYNRKA